MMSQTPGHRLRPVPGVLQNEGAVMPRQKTTRKKSEGPVTVKEALSSNVRTQQRRSARTESPPEAKRPVRERVHAAQTKRKQDSSRAARH